jgi:hypothetical protein
VSAQHAGRRIIDRRLRGLSNLAGAEGGGHAREPRKTFGQQQGFRADRQVPDPGVDGLVAGAAGQFSAAERAGKPIEVWAPAP